MTANICKQLGCFCIATTLVVLVATGCSRSYTFKAFSFPPESAPHESDWDYYGEIVVLHNRGAPPKESGDKTARVTIINKNKEVVLNDQFQLTGGLFDHEITWLNFNHIVVETYSKSNREITYIDSKTYRYNGKQFNRVAPMENCSVTNEWRIKLESIKPADVRLVSVFDCGKYLSIGVYAGSNNLSTLMESIDKKWYGHPKLKTLGEGLSLERTLHIELNIKQEKLRRKMGQKIIAPDDEWIDYVAKMWLLGSQISKDIIGHEMDGSPQDIERLQAILDSGQIPVNNTQELQSLGIVFGKVFVNETPDYDWWVVEDEYGKDPCIRYLETDLLVFPQTMISKRIEDGEEVNVSALYQGLKNDIERIVGENYSNE